MVVAAQVDLAGFNASLALASRNLTVDVVPRFVGSLALQLLRGFVLGTRVDTGLARGNWRVGIGKIPESPIRRISKTGSGPLTVGAQQAARFKLADRFIAITNNVPYIGKLEELDGMIALTLANVSQSFVAPSSGGKTLDRP